MNGVKIFTPKTATQTLPLVKKIVQDILAAGQEIRGLSVQIGAHAEEDPRVVRLMDQLEELFVEIENLGCSYRDWNFTVGLVDFPAKIGGQEVYLCWRSDEEEIKFFHEAEAGFAGRKPIPQEYF
ncbi:MAG TPA: DUF2203 domain-containing protein [Candidatus Omnitrophota bacterium]|nr:DUF2203 domain-containing protein [Candidatus Omnitrophota bacterium]